jgi:hypothetical protein
MDGGVRSERLDCEHWYLTSQDNHNRLLMAPGDGMVVLGGQSLGSNFGQKCSRTSLSRRKKLSGSAIGCPLVGRSTSTQRPKHDSRLPIHTSPQRSSVNVISHEYNLPTCLGRYPTSTSIQSLSGRLPCVMIRNFYQSRWYPECSHLYPQPYAVLQPDS